MYDHDDDYHPQVALKSERVSRRERRCHTCGGTIKAGERYVRWFLPPDEEHGKGMTVIEHVGGGMCVFGADPF
jgi:hypothetical protein